MEFLITRSNSEILIYKTCFASRTRYNTAMNCRVQTVRDKIEKSDNNLTSKIFGKDVTKKICTLKGL